MTTGEMLHQDYIQRFRSCLKEPHPIFTSGEIMRQVYMAECTMLANTSHLNNDEVAERLRKLTTAYKLVVEELFDL